MSFLHNFKKPEISCHLINDGDQFSYLLLTLRIKNPLSTLTSRQQFQFFQISKVTNEEMVQARSQDFLWGEGGGVRTSRTGTKLINVLIIRHGTSEVTRGQSVQPTDYLKTEIGRLLMVRETIASAEGASR